MFKKNENNLISFCIPTYNRSLLLEKTVKTILEYPNDEIEVVVVDNNSTDDTKNRMMGIKDARLSYYKNNKNLGAALNIIETFKKAKGEWVFTLSDEDWITNKIIMNIISVLTEDDSISCNVMLGNVQNSSGPYRYYVYHDGFGYVPYKWNHNIFKAGDEALLNVGFLHRYLSGVAIRRNSLNEGIMNFFNPSVHGVAPHTVLYTASCVTGNARTCNLDFCIKAVQRAEKSYVEKIGKKNYRHPDNKFQVFTYYTQLTDKLVIDELVKVEIISKLYGYYLDLCTYDWYNMLQNQKDKKYFDIEEPNAISLHALINSFKEKSEHMLNELSLSDQAKDTLKNKNIEKYLHFIKKRNIQI